MPQQSDSRGDRSLLRLPTRGGIQPVDPQAEPTRYYYWPVVGWFYRERLRMVLDLIAGRTYGRLLDVAYGSGLFLPSLAEHCGSLYGMDLHWRGEVVCANLASQHVDAELVAGDATDMPFASGSFECITFVSLLEHLSEPGRAIDEMLRLLKPGGVLALGFPCRNLWMDGFFRLVGYNPRQIHPSSHQDILEAVTARCPEPEVRILPSFLPVNHALYCACLLQR